MAFGLRNGGHDALNEKHPTQTMVEEAGITDLRSAGSRGTVLLVKTVVNAELPPELLAKARAFVAEGWAGDFDELLAEALRRYLDTHSASLTEQFVREDVEWGLRGHD
jgi:hypothetical protein